MHRVAPRERGADFGVLGTNNGISFTRNPCLVRQLAWAKRLPLPPAFYANTGNPGPQRAKHWPIGQTAPRVCTTSEPNSIGCSYDYGWNAAWQSYTVATDAAQRLHRVDRVNARHRAANVEWWLDVETMNSWQGTAGRPSHAAQRRDVATIQGEVDALRTAGVESVGIYSTAYQWKRITGGQRVTQGRFAGLPQWMAGYESHAAAATGCSHDGFTGGPVRMTQYLGRDGFDSDVLSRGGRRRLTYVSIVRGRVPRGSTCLTSSLWWRDSASASCDGRPSGRSVSSRRVKCRQRMTYTPIMRQRTGRYGQR